MSVRMNWLRDMANAHCCSDVPWMLWSPSTLASGLYFQQIVRDLLKKIKFVPGTPFPIMTCCMLGSELSYCRLTLTTHHDEILFEIPVIWMEGKWNPFQNAFYETLAIFQASLLHIGRKGVHIRIFRCNLFCNQPDEICAPSEISGNTRLIMLAMSHGRISIVWQYLDDI